MRKESYSVRCDGAGCRELVDVEKGQTPEGWYRIYQADATLKATENHSFDLCSLKCVSKWASARADVLGEPLRGKKKTGSTFPKDIQCPFCDPADERRFAAQGIGMHIASTHGTEEYELYRTEHGMTRDRRVRVAS